MEQLTFTYTVTDGSETDTATVTVTINPDLDQPPVVANAIADFEVEEGSGNRVFDLSTLFTDPDNDDVLITKTLVSNSNPNLVEAIINGDVFTLNFQAGETGSTEITIEGRSNGKTVTDTFTATITEIDEVDAPLEIVAPKKLSLLKMRLPLPKFQFLDWRTQRLGCELKTII